MPRSVTGGLIQAAVPLTDPSLPIEKVRQAAIDAHIPLIEEAGRRGVQILGLEEVFNGPYFCPSQDAHWYDLAEPVPGPTTELMAQYAKKYQMAMVVPVYEREQAGVYYNTAAVYDSDGRYLGKYRKTHIPHTSGFWEKYFFKPGNLGYPTFETRYARIGVYICYDRHFPEGARADCTGPRSSSTLPPPSPGSRSTSGSSSSPRTRSRTATSWRRATGSEPR